MREMTPAEVLQRLSEPEPELPPLEGQEKLPSVSLKRFCCERFLRQEMGAGRLPYSFGMHNRGYWERDREPHGDWDTPERRLDDLYIFSVVGSPLTNEQVETFVRAYISQNKLPEPMLIYTMPSYRACGECDAHFSLYTDGLKIWTPHTCPHPNGPPPYWYDFEFPSGKIVIENDSRHLLPDHGDLGGNGSVWEQRITSYYAQRQMAHFFVGNTCPGFWRVGPDSYIIAPRPHDANYDDIEVPWERLGGICTDLWWYSIMDHDKYFDLGGKAEKFHQDIIEVTPGTYRFTHQYHLVRDVGGVEEVYTRIEKIS
jgi:hypothetical protein